MPPGVVKVDRSTSMGNSYQVGSPVWREKGFGKIKDAAEAVSLFRRREAPYIVRNNLAKLRGKDLGCWCKLCPAHQNGKPFDVECSDCAPCHADVLGELANRPLASIPSE